MEHNDIKRIELDLLIEAIKRRYGYDFSHYAMASLRRRVDRCLRLSKTKTVSELIPKIIHDETFFNDMLVGLSITVTEMFRDASFYEDFRKLIIPKLRTYSNIRIWHAGCATGEEVYSMAILLHEEGMLDQSIIYATDFNNKALEVAKRGVYPIDLISEFAKNYYKSGGNSEFADYYRSRYNSAKMCDFLTENVTFANHNLVSDGVFGEMNVIICRNVMIYFDRTLQNRVYSLFTDSMTRRGFLCLGNKDTVSYSDVGHKYVTLSGKNRLFQLSSETNQILPPYRRHA